MSRISYIYTRICYKVNSLKLFKSMALKEKRIHIQNRVKDCEIEPVNEHSSAKFMVVDLQSFAFEDFNI